MDRLLTGGASVTQTSGSGARQFGKIDIDDLDNDPLGPAETAGPT
jgi:hypothetical protein